MFRYQWLAVVVVCVVTASVGLGQDWPSVPVIEHSTYQAVNSDGTSAYSGTFPIRLIGVVLNNTEDWLDATPGYTPAYTPYAMGGQAEFYAQAVNLDGTAWDPAPGSTFGDFGGTACWIGQNYGNLPFKGDPIFSYTDAQWTAELGRLNLWGGDGVTDPIRAGDLVEIRARAGLNYAGKMNVNEQHDNDYDREDNWDGLGSDGDGHNHDYEIVVLAPGYGLPAATGLRLSDLKEADDSFIFDSTRNSGGERYQCSLVELLDVWVSSPAIWSADGDITVTDGLRTFNVHLGLTGFDGTELFGVGEPFNVTGILDQASSSGVYGTDGYQLLALDPGGFSPVPEPTCLALLLLGGSMLLSRRRRRQ